MDYAFTWMARNLPLFTGLQKSNRRRRAVLFAVLVVLFALGYSVLPAGQASSSTGSTLVFDDPPKVGSSSAHSQYAVRMAICVVGSKRTFEKFSHNIYDTVAAHRSNETLIDYFFWLTDDAIPTSKGTAFEASGGVNAVNELLALFQPKFVTLNGTTPFHKNSNCAYPESSLKNGQGPDREYDHSGQSYEARTWETYAKLTACYDKVVEYERKVGMLYTHVHRLRPDIMFYDKLDREVLASPVPVFPNGRHGCTGYPCFNDHLAFLPRSAAGDYLTLSRRYDNCKGDLGHSFRLIHYATFLNEHRWNGKARTMRVPYTLVRPEGVSCGRAGFWWRLADGWGAGLRFTKKKNDREIGQCQDYCTANHLSAADPCAEGAGGPFKRECAIRRRREGKLQLGSD